MSSTCFQNLEILASVSLFNYSCEYLSRGFSLFSLVIADTEHFFMINRMASSGLFGNVVPGWQDWRALYPLIRSAGPAGTLS